MRARRAAQGKANVAAFDAHGEFIWSSYLF
jgi:hypothetical protein